MCSTVDCRLQKCVIIFGRDGLLSRVSGEQPRCAHVPVALRQIPVAKLRIWGRTLEDGRYAIPQ